MDDICTLRFQVYCKERKFLRAENYVDGRERDRFDQRAVHYAAYNSEGEIVGAMRLVLSPGGQAFPYTEYCSIFPRTVLPPRTRCAEVSRRVVRSSYRKPRDETVIGLPAVMNRSSAARDKNDWEYTRIARRTPPARIVMSLYRNIYRFCVRQDITHLFAAMEKPLARILERYDFPFVAIGPQVDYYGPVSLYLLDWRELESRLGETNPALLDWVRRDGTPAIPPSPLPT